MDTNGETQVTVADILNYENYGILSTAPSIMTKPTPPVESTFTGGAKDTSSLLLAQAAYQQALLQYQADLADYNANLANMIIDMITRASIAITEIDQDTTLLTSGGATDTAENRVALLETLFDVDATNDNKVLTISFSDGSQIDCGTVSGVDSLGIFSDLSYFDDMFGGLIDFTTPDDLPVSLDVL